MFPPTNHLPWRRKLLRILASRRNLHRYWLLPSKDRQRLLELHPSRCQIQASTQMPQRLLDRLSREPPAVRMYRHPSGADRCQKKWLSHENQQHIARPSRQISVEFLYCCGATIEITRRLKIRRTRTVDKCIDRIFCHFIGRHLYLSIRDLTAIPIRTHGFGIGSYKCSELTDARIDLPRTLTP